MCASTYDLLFVERLERAALNDEKQEIHRTALNSQLTLLESTHIHLITTTYTHVLSHLLFVQDAHPRSLPRCCKCENKLGSITDGLKPLFNPEKKKISWTSEDWNVTSQTLHGDGLTHCNAHSDTRSSHSLHAYARCACTGARRQFAREWVRRRTCTVQRLRIEISTCRIRGETATRIARWSTGASRERAEAASSGSTTSATRC